MKRPISDDVRRFVLLAVPSVPYLEAILLLRSLGRPLETAEAASRLYLPEARVASLLDSLVAAGIAERVPPGYRYAPQPLLGSVLDDVARAYSTNLIGIAELIHSRTERQAARFADAFRIRKEP